MNWGLPSSAKLLAENPFCSVHENLSSIFSQSPEKKKGGLLNNLLFLITVEKAQLT